MLSVLPESSAKAVEAEAPEVSVVMPCLNEARTVARCVAKARDCLARLGVHGEVVVADNGSNDGSPALARAEGARVVHVPVRGYGAALQAGIAAAHGRYIIMGDADDSYDFSRLDPFIDRLRQGDELVMGNRFAGGIQPGAMPWLHRYVGNPVLSGILNLFFRTPVGDAHCGLRGFRKDAYNRLGLTTPGMEFASEMVVRACLHKQKVSEVPTTLAPDGRDRPPHLRSFRDGWRHLRFLLLMCPLWLYWIPAAALLTGGLGLMTWLTAGPQHIAGASLNLGAMLFGALAVIVGHQAWWLGACAMIHGWTSGLWPPDARILRLAEQLRLERGLIWGLLWIVAGLGFLATGWLAPDGDTALRGAIWGFTLMALGAQAIFGSFFLALLGMNDSAREARAKADLSC